MDGSELLDPVVNLPYPESMEYDNALLWALGTDSVEEAVDRFQSYTDRVLGGAGWAGIRFNPGSRVARIDVYVCPRHRGSGAGVKLARAGIARAWRMGAEKVQFQVLSGNPFYKDPIRALAFIGAHHEGTMKRQIMFQGSIQDILFFAVFRDGTK